jgi:hypothetical protein
MRAGSIFLALVATLSLAALGARPAHACSCMDVPLENDVRSSDAVFSGEARSIDEEATAGGGGMAAP